MFSGACEYNAPLTLGTYIVQSYDRICTLKHTHIHSWKLLALRLPDQVSDVQMPKPITNSKKKEKRRSNTEWKRERRVVSAPISIHRYEKTIEHRTLHLQQAKYEGTTFTNNSLASLRCKLEILVYVVCVFFFRLWLRWVFCCMLRFCSQVKKKKVRLLNAQGDRKERRRETKIEKKNNTLYTTNRVRFSCVSFLGFPSRGVFWRLSHVWCQRNGNGNFTLN